MGNLVCARNPYDGGSMYELFQKDFGTPKHCPNSRHYQRSCFNLKHHKSARKAVGASSAFADIKRNNFFVKRSLSVTSLTSRKSLARVARNHAAKLADVRSLGESPVTTAVRMPKNSSSLTFKPVDTQDDGEAPNHKGALADVTFNDNDIDVEVSEDSDGNFKLKCQKFRKRTRSANLLLRNDEDEKSVSSDSGSDENVEDLDVSGINFEQYEKQPDDLDCYFSDDLFFEICIGNGAPVLLGAETKF